MLTDAQDFLALRAHLRDLRNIAARADRRITVIAQNLDRRAPNTPETLAYYRANVQTYLRQITATLHALEARSGTDQATDQET